MKSNVNELICTYNVEHKMESDYNSKIENNKYIEKNSNTFYTINALNE